MSKAVFSTLAAVLLISCSPALAAVEGGGVDALYDRITGEMMCLCGCNQTVKNCPHTDCGFAIPAKKEIRALLEQGKTYDEVVAIFVKREGEVVLSSPKKEGFNLLGYIMPFLALAVAGSGVAIAAKKWAARGERAHAEPGAAPPQAGGEAESGLSEKLKKELEEFDS